MTIFTTFWVKTRKPRSKDFESLELKLNSFDSRTSIENQPEYVPLIYKVWTSQVKNSVCVQSGWFLFFAWFYHSKNSGSGFWHWEENCKNNLHKIKETRAFWHRVSSCFVLIRTTLKNSRWKKGLRPFFHSNFFMSSSSELNITPRFAKNSRFLDFRFFVDIFRYNRCEDLSVEIPVAGKIVTHVGHRWRRRGTSGYIS